MSRLAQLACVTLKGSSLPVVDAVVVLQAIVLLIALVSGLCCLVDLDTPTKFEVPAES